MDTKGNEFRDHECIVNNEVMEINKITKSNEYEKNRIDNNLLVVSGKKQGMNISVLSKQLAVDFLSNPILILNSETCFLYLVEKMNWIPVCIAGFVAMLAVLCFVVSVTTCVKARSKKKEPKAVTSDQGTNMKNSFMTHLQNNHPSIASEFLIYFIHVFQSCQKTQGLWLWTRRPVVSAIQSRNRAAAQSPSARRTLKVNS